MGETTHSNAQLIFFDGLLTDEDYKAERFCMLDYDLREAPVESTDWYGNCDATGSWGGRPTDYAQDAWLVLGAGPLPDIVATKLKDTWDYRGTAWVMAFDQA